MHISLLVCDLKYPLNIYKSSTGKADNGLRQLNKRHHKKAKPPHLQDTFVWTCTSTLSKVMVLGTSINQSRPNTFLGTCPSCKTHTTQLHGISFM